MIFTSLEFLLFFVVLLCLFLVVKASAARRVLLLTASYVFYAAWNPMLLWLILFVSVSAWGFAILLDQSSGARKKLYLTSGLLCGLSVLGYYKYANFFLESFYDLFSTEASPVLDILLPVGISFYTFQAVSYLVDVYRGDLQAERRPLNFFLYIAFFPQLVAGPIVRATELLPQLKEPIRLRRQDFIIGGQIFLAGAIQKVVVADNLAVFVDPVFADPAFYTAETLRWALLAYGVQLFCDFSGYSLMAIGVARILGFVLPQNFDFPYLATNLAELWRRWHMTLSRWMRDYLYIPLGGNRASLLRTDFNLMMTMLLGGLWHGASWNFVMWGAINGGGLILQRHWSRYFGHGGLGQSITRTLPYLLLAWLLTQACLFLSWVFFRTQDFAGAMLYLQRMVATEDGVRWVHTPSLWILAGVAVWHLLYLAKARTGLWMPVAQPWRFAPALLLIGGLMLIVLIAPLHSSPFVYFQF